MMIRADLHIHTRYSPDSLITFPEMVRRCWEQGIDMVAILDHDEIEGALDFRDKAESLRAEGEWAPRIIVGEEVRTTKGEVAGLFLKERVEDHMTPKETMEAIRAQGGLVYIPHPFDYLKLKRLSARELLEHMDLIDIIEVFNGKPRYPGANLSARNYLKKHQFPAGAGSDAHTKEHIGLVSLVMEDFEGTRDFTENLWKASIQGKQYWLISRAYYHIKGKLRGSD